MEHNKREWDMSQMTLTYGQIILRTDLAWPYCHFHDDDDGSYEKVIRVIYFNKAFNYFEICVNLLCTQYTFSVHL